MKALVLWVTLAVLVFPSIMEAEPLGPGSRRTGLVISEILYGLQCCEEEFDDDDDGPGLCWYTDEFIEIYNSNPYFENIGGFELAGNISHRFPEGTTIPGGGFLVLRHFDFAGSLAGCKGVRLLDKGGAVLAEVTYTNQPPWPLAQNTGHSIVLNRPSYGQNNPKAWSLSDVAGGSPGAAEPFVVRPSDAVRINEVISPWQFDYQSAVELYNHSNEPVDVSHYAISTLGFEVIITEGTTIPAQGFVSFILPLRAQTGALYLISSSRDHMVDSVWYQKQAESDYWGRYPDGADGFYPLSGGSLGGSNERPLRSQVVINEIMYAPITGKDDDEYVELYNRGAVAIDLGGWQISGGIQFTFGAETIIGPSNYLVVAKDPVRFLGRYGNLTSLVTGGFAGELGDDGDSIVLVNASGAVVEEVTYGVGGQWGTWSRGAGSSLELKDSRSDGRYAHNWADSDESSKGVWTTVEGIGSIGEVLGVANDDLQIFLLGAGECLADDVEVRGNAGQGNNAISTNPSFEQGATGWTFQGSHDHSVIASTGFSGGSSLHLRAATRGDAGPSRVRSAKFNAALSTTDKVLLRARVKWIRGSPEIVLRLHGGGFEVSGRMQIQANGTPGARNSRAVDNVGPAITEVSHHPPLPAANEPVRITAMAYDRDRPSTLALKFRVEPSATYVTAPMLDNGIGGDAVAGDGVYTATVTGQPAGARMGFYLEAIDALGAANTFPQDVFPTPPYDRVFPTDAHNRECIVRWGETVLPGSFGTYHLWLNATNTARWANRRPLLNDTPLDATFVYNNSRVIYNVRPAYHSSPWHRGQRMTGPDGMQRVDYSVDFAASDPFLGATEALWINPGNPGGNGTSDGSAQAESAANTILRGFGLQNNYQRYVHLFVNGNRRSMNGTQPFIMQDAQRPNVDTVDQWSPGDGNGDLIWLEDWYEYPDNGDDFTANNDADLTRREITLYGANGFASGTAFHMAAYRQMFRLADVRAGRSANDYSTLFALLNTVSPTSGGPIRLAAIEPVIDYQQWMRMFAAQHAFGNWDTYGYDRGRNAYMYRSSGGRVQMWAWKNNFTLGIGGHSASQDLFGSTDPRILAMWQEPTILRAYWQGFYDLIRGPLRSEYMDAILDARAAALQNNGVSFSPGQVATIKTFIRDRRTYLASRMTMATNVPLTAVVINTNGNVLTLRGTAPIQVHFITINGAQHPITWSAVSNISVAPTNWTAQVVMEPGLNNFTIAGYDSTGALVRGPVVVPGQYDGPVAAPQDNVIISEIMYRGAQPKTEYVELYNKSSNYSFDLFRWRVDGLEFEFPAGAILGPNQFMVVAKDLFSFGSAFAGQNAPFTFPGELDPLGETLSVIQGNTGTVIDRVRYEAVAPWPAGAYWLGSALQVVDMEEDNSRVSNWTDGLGWRYATFTGTNAGSANPASRGTNFFLWLGSPGALYVDDIKLVLGATPEAGVNVLQNGDFEAPLEGTWTGGGNHGGSLRSTEVSHSGEGSLRIVATGNGSVNANFVRQYIPGNTTNALYTLSFWFLPTTNGSILHARTAPGSRFQFETPIIPIVATPGQSNSFPIDLPPYDPIWLNEMNGSWFELYNAGTEIVDLNDYYLANNYGPPGLLEFDAFINPGEFKVFDLLAPPVTGQLELGRMLVGGSQIVDYFNYEPSLYGALPDGQPFTRGILRYPTPGLSNLSPRIKSIVQVTRYIYITAEVIPGYRYNLEYKDNLAQSDWSVLVDGIIADEPDFEYADEPPGSQRFYRLALIP